MTCLHWLHRLLAVGALLAATALPSLAADGSDDKGSDDKPSADKASADEDDARAKLFKELDKNGDAVLTDDELGPEQQRMFQRLLRTSDKNNDGKLSRQEFLSGTDSPPPADNRGDRPRGDRRPGQGGGQGPEPEAIFNQLDANGDGKIVIAEVPEERRDRFAILIERFDADGDAALTLVEFTKGLRAMRAGGDGGGRPPMPPGPPGDGLMRALDTDRDGKLSKDEIEDAPKALKKLDRNDDGEITRAELGGPQQYAAAGGPEGSGSRPRGEGDRPGGQGRDGRGPGVQQFIDRMDKNDDGKLSKDEVGERLRERFDEVDTNSDGYLDRAELTRVFSGMRRGDGQGRPDGERPGTGEGNRGGQGRDGQRRPGPKLMLERNDKNDDGKLSKDEAPEWMKQNFDRLDANSDGFIDLDELQKAAEKLGRNRPRDRDNNQ